MSKTTKMRAQCRRKRDAQCPKDVNSITRPSVREIEVRNKRIRIAGRYVFGTMALLAAMWMTAWVG